MASLYTLSSEALTGKVTVVGFRGAEAISRLYQLDVYLRMDNADAELSADDVLGKPVTLHIHHAQHPHRVHGLISTFELVAMLDKQTLFRTVVVPRMWQLTQSLHSRVFTDSSLPEIIRSVLESAGLTGDDYALQLSQSYPSLEYVCQYRESDFDFISRWLEREGLYYYFEHGDSSEKLVITDDKAFHATREDPARFVERHGSDVSAGEALTSFSSVFQALPEKVSVYDYDYQNPALVLEESEQVSAGKGVIATHNAGFPTERAVKRTAQVRAEELKVGRSVFRGAGTLSGLCAGMVFSLEEHPRAGFNQDYLVTGLELSGNQFASGNGDSEPPSSGRGPRSKGKKKKKASDDPFVELAGLDDDVYRVSLVAIPADVQFRARSTTPWPRIYGYESGVTSGAAASSYAQVDPLGRYKVKLLFDESDLAGDHVSAWLRMMQPHGGDVEGFHFPLRAGVEVIVTFLGGDPDRPVIAGFVPNGTHPSPVTDLNPMQNVIVTGGLNRMVFDDTTGRQSIQLSTPVEDSAVRLGTPSSGDDHNLVLSTTGRMSSHAGRDRDVSVGGKLGRTVVGDVTETYCATLTQSVGSEEDRTVEGVEAKKTLDQTVVTQQVFGNVDQKVDGEVTQTVEGAVSQTVNGDVTQVLEKDLEQTVKGKVELAYNAEEGGAFDAKGDAAYYHTVAGSAFQQATEDWKIKAKKAEMESESYFLTSTGSHWETVIGNRVDITLLGHNRVIGIEAVDIVAGGELKVVLGLELGYTLAKIELTTMAYHNHPMSFHDAGVKIRNAGAAIADIASVIRNGGIDIGDFEIGVIM